MSSTHWTTSPFRIIRCAHARYVCKYQSCTCMLSLMYEHSTLNKKVYTFRAQGDRSAHLVANTRAALVSGAAGGGTESRNKARIRYVCDSQSCMVSFLVSAGGKRDYRRYALTPVVFCRFSEHKTVDPNYQHKSGVTALLSQLLLTGVHVLVLCTMFWHHLHNTSNEIARVYFL